MRVFVQHRNGVPVTFTALTTAEGFRQRGYEVVPFAVEEIDARDWLRGEPVVGGVGAIRRIFARMGVTWTATTYPPELHHFLRRKVEVKALGELSRDSMPVFIKPFEDSKQFTGFVCYDPFDRRLGNLEPQLPVYACEPIEFVTEYRVYVLDKKILNAARYTGPVDCVPNFATIRAMIMAYQQAPIAYSLDVGVTNDKETVLVETNDAFSLGNYGLPAALMAKMVAARWFQMVGLPFQDEAACRDSPGFINQH